MSFYETAQIVEFSRARGEDRVAVIGDDQRTIIVVADGAGGIGHGDQAADTVIREIEEISPSIRTVEDWVAALERIDCRIGAGESTGLVVDLRADTILGAGVGDTCAWMISGEEIIDLTASQVRKPLLGTGNARPAGFKLGSLDGILLVATDGLCNYVKRDELVRLVAQSEFVEIPRKCVELVRLPSGELWDDIGIVACRRAWQVRTKKEYTI